MVTPRRSARSWMSFVAFTDTVRFSRSRDTPNPRIVRHGPHVHSGYLASIAAANQSRMACVEAAMTIAVDAMT